MLTDEQVRAEFEAWAAAMGYPLERLGESYASILTAGAWQGWRAGYTAGMREAARIANAEAERFQADRYGNHMEGADAVMNAILRAAGEGR